jgi:toxin ParE1/3/4
LIRTVVVHESARADVCRVFAYLSAFSVESANDVFDAIEAAFQFLAETPGAGPICGYSEPDLADLRFWPVKKFRNYIVIYRPLPNGVEIARVIHAATDIGRAFSGQ